MTNRVLVPLDGSSQSWAALEYAIEERRGIDVTALHVIDPVEGGYEVQVGDPFASEEWYRRAREEADDLLAEARDRAEAAGVELDTATEVGRPPETIVEYAEREGLDEIVVGSHGRSGVSRILLGSVAEAVVRRSSIPVTVVR